MTDNIIIFCIDVGAVRNIGYARVSGADVTTGTDLDELLALIVRDLGAGGRVALGFECPAFIPYPVATAGLCKARIGEGNRSWCAGAGPFALAIGAHEAAHVLRDIAEGAARQLRVGYDDQALLAGELDLLVWEAFVSNKAPSPDPAAAHMADARAAALEFRRRLDTGRVETDILDTEVFNLVGAAILRAGLSDDLGLLNLPCIVVKAAVST